MGGPQRNRPGRRCFERRPALFPASTGPGPTRRRQRKAQARRPNSAFVSECTTLCPRLIGLYGISQISDHSFQARRAASACLRSFFAVSKARLRSTQCTLTIVTRIPGRHFVRNLVERRALVAQLVRRDFEQRYVGSAAGWLWGVIHPLVLLLSWTFVFQICLKITLPPGEVTQNYTLFLFCGILQ